MILFLDFDGVTHPKIIGAEYFCRTGLLWKILRACPDVSVAFSTSWREAHKPEELRNFATYGGGEDLVHRFVGQTPRIHAQSDYDPRGLECHRWLESNGHSGSGWLALDDDPKLFHPMFRQNLYVVNGGTGLTEADAAAIITICNSASPLSSVFGSAWGKQALANVQRMTVDEEFHKSISKDLS